jgi:hypothetical protein
MPHIFTRADKVHVYSLCDGSATVAVEEYGDSLLSAKFWINECFPKFSTHCMRVVHVPVLILHLNGNINKIWMALRRFFSWESVVPLLADRKFLCISEFHKQEYGES